MKKKKKLFHLIPITFLLLLGLMILESCEKDKTSKELLQMSESIEKGNNSAIASSRSEVSEITEITTPDEANEALAIALSKALHDSEAVRQFIVDKSDKNEIRHREILLGLTQNEVVSEGKSFEEILTENTSAELATAYSENLVNTMLSQNPLLTIKIPDRFINVDWNVAEMAPTVRVISRSGETVDYYNGQVLVGNPLSENQSIFFVKVGSSELHTLVDLETLETISGNKLSTLYSEEIIACESVVNTLAEKEEYPFMLGYILVNIMEDIFEKYETSCAVGSAPPPPPPTGDPCEEDCFRDCGQDGNFWKSIALNDLASFEVIDNQPCPGGEDVFVFKIFWAHVKNGQSQRAEEFPKAVYRNDLLIPGTVSTQYTIIGFTTQMWGTATFQVPIWGYIITEEPATLNPVAMDRHIFGESVFINEWTLDDQGDYFGFNVEEIDELSCTYVAGQSSTSDQEVSIGVEVNVFKKIIGIGGTIEYEFSHTKKVDQKWTYKANSSVNCGKSGANYCGVVLSDPGSETLKEKAYDIGLVTLNMEVPLYE